METDRWTSPAAINRALAGGDSSGDDERRPLVIDETGPDPPSARRGCEKARFKMPSLRPEVKAEYRVKAQHSPLKLTITKSSSEPRKKKRDMSESALLRRYGCEQQPRVVLRRLSKSQVLRLSRPRANRRRPMPQSKIDQHLQAAALMELLRPKAGPNLEKKTYKILHKVRFAPTRFPKRHNTAQVEQLGKVPKRPGVAPHKIFPRELVGLLERDIERAVPLQKFVDNEHRGPKIDWLVLDGKMQHSLLHRELLQRSVRVKILVPPMWYAKRPEQPPPQCPPTRVDTSQYVLSDKAKKSHALVSKFMTDQMARCCNDKAKAAFSEARSILHSRSLLELFPTPSISVERLQSLLPRHWSAPGMVPGSYVLRGVSPLSAEFEDVRAKFNKSCRERVLAVDRVLNPHLWFRYQLKRESLQQRSPVVQELHLFHGTNKRHLESILSFNLNWTYHGAKKGSRFGQGMYFSPLSSYSLHYTDRCPRHSVMLMFRVMTVRQCIGFDDMNLPDESYDAAVSENGKVWAKFDVDQIYPDYVIHFCYDDPEEKAELISRHRKNLARKQSEMWKKKYAERVAWGVSGNKRHQRRPMTWRKFFFKVKRWQPRPQRPSRGIRLRCAEWQGPSQVVTKGQQRPKDKLHKAPFKHLSIWKRPQQFNDKNKKTSKFIYKAKKRF